MTVPSWTDRAAALLRLDGNAPYCPATVTRTALATMAALAGSLAADAVLVMLATRLLPSTRGYVHFRFSDYGELTVIGVLGACLSWPLTVRFSSAPRWLFLRLAVLATLVLWLPDIWILAKGQPAQAVGVLMAMHLAIALVTYNVLVHLAPAHPRGRALERSAATLVAKPSPERFGGWDLSPWLARRAGILMVSLVGVELALGIGTLVIVPYDRPDVWLPAHGHLLYLVHAALGGMLGLGALVLLPAARRAPRPVYLGTIVGCVGVLLAALGGLASVGHATRLLGVGLMLVGAVVAGFGYIMLIVPVAPPEAP